MGILKRKQSRAWKDIVERAIAFTKAGGNVEEELKKPYAIYLWYDGELSCRAQDSPRYRASAPILGVDSLEQGQKLIQSAAATHEVNGERKWFVPGWQCPTVPNDEVRLARIVSPAFERHLDNAAKLIRPVATVLRRAYGEMRKADQGG